MIFSIVLSVTWVVAIHEEGVVFIHSVGDALSIARAELSRDQISGEDGLLTSDVPVVDDVSYRSNQIAVAQILFLFCARIVNEKNVAVLVAVDFVYIVRICRQQTQVVGSHTGCEVFSRIIPPVSIMPAEIPFQGVKHNCLADPVRAIQH